MTYWKTLESLEEGSEVELEDGVRVLEPGKGHAGEPQVLWSYLSPLRRARLKEKPP